MLLPDDITTTTLTHWMVENKMSRAQLADTFGLSKASIDRWMSIETIPHCRKIRIAQIFNDHMERQQDHLRINATTGRVRTDASLYTTNEWALLRQAADIMGISTEEFQKNAVVWALRNLQNAPVKLNEPDTPSTQNPPSKYPPSR